MREIVVLRADVKAFRELVQRPPAPSFVNDRLPDALAKLLPSKRSAGSGKRLVAFLSPGCQPCQDLADALTEAIDAGDVAAEDVTPVIWAFSTQQAEDHARRLRLRG